MVSITPDAFLPYKTIFIAPSIFMFLLFVICDIFESSLLIHF